MTTPGGTTATRSSFVTGLAWTFVALGGVATLVTLLQNVMLSVMYSADDFRAPSSDDFQQLPAFLRFIVNNFQLFFASAFVLSAATLLSAIGLLKRQNWARLLFILIMLIGMLWNLAAIAMPFVMQSWMSQAPAHAQAAMRGEFELMWAMMTAVAVIIGLAFAILFGWIIKRLMAQDVRREFLAP